MFFLLALVILAYSFIQFFELLALLGRFSGVESNSVLIGYSIQQSVYMITRFFMIALLPVLGYLIDSGVSLYDFELMAHLSLLFSSVLSMVVLLFFNRVVAYYLEVIKRYRAGFGFIRSYFFLKGGQVVDCQPKIKDVFVDRRVFLVFCQSSFVFLVYCVGIFLSFYTALLFSEYRATISQMSGIVNALGAVVLTLYIEPKISKSIDTKSEGLASSYIYALFLGRCFVLAFSGQLLLFFVFWLV